MKKSVYIASLLLSAPNLIAGTASLVLRHSFATRNPLRIVTDFLFQVVWGVPFAALLFVVLIVLGVVARTQPYVALFALMLNAVALALVLSMIGFPHHVEQGLFFLPILLAVIGLAWIAYPVFRRRSRGRGGH